ncbi:MAG: TonB-dependent receptor [Bacteroidales bacterium]|nr:TonB-dependent receptor [Bacteroidales bacterium]
MKKTTAMKVLVLSVAMVMPLFMMAQRIKVSGHVVDATNGEPVLFASCVEMSSGRGTTTNNYGYFSLETTGETTIGISCIGYQSFQQPIKATADTTVVIRISPKVNDLQEVVVSTFVPRREQVEMGKSTVPVELIKAIPSLAGEPDILKSISYLPGISLGKEGYSNIYVRGGDRGQNLVLLDGIKIYNTSHVGGFVSLFNSDVVKHVDVYKGGFPAQYGGRASSVIDVATKDGNREGFAMKASIGLISSNAIVEMPLGKKVSMYAAARTSYLALFQAKNRKKFYDNNYTGSYWNYTFYDINSKVKWLISDRSSMSLSMFLGNDVQSFADGQCSYNPQYPNDKDYERDRTMIKNRGISLTHVTGRGSCFWRNTLSVSKYDNVFIAKNDRTEHNVRDVTSTRTTSSIKDATLQSRVEVGKERNKVKAGIEVARYKFLPGIIRDTYTNDKENMYTDTVKGSDDMMGSWEMSAYVSDEIRISDRWAVEAGIRASLYKCSGACYRNIEPRLSTRYMLGDRLSLKANYTRMNQYNHVMVTNRFGIEKEIWVASTKDLKPQRADQWSMGLFYGDEDQKLDVSLEGFYKKLNDQIEYLKPVDNSDNLTSIEQSVTRNGKGRGYGIEMMVSKELDKVSLSLSYTLSWNERRFPSLNDGKWFPFTYDRRHDVNLLALWHINRRWSLTGNFTISTGTPVTLPVAYNAGDNLVTGYFIYDGINNRRLPLYHRLDTSLSYNLPMTRGHKQQLTLNIFNTYARLNASTIYYSTWSNSVRQVSMFSIIPTISYTFTL